MSLPAADIGAEPAISPGRFRTLRYWSVNMWLTSWSFPGFSYTDAEVARMKALADATSRNQVIVWLAATVAIYLALAGVLMTGVFAMLSILWPAPAGAPEAGFFGALLLAAAAMVGLGMPLSINLGGGAADLLSGLPPPTRPGDGALAAKIAGQFRRMGMIVAAAMVVIAMGMGLLGRR